MRVDNYASGRPILQPRDTHCKKRIVDERCLDADQNRVVLRSEEVTKSSRALASDPLTLPGRERDLPIERLSDLESNEGPALSNTPEETLVEAFRLSSQCSSLDKDACVTKTFETRASHP